MYYLNRNDFLWSNPLLNMCFFLYSLTHSLVLASCEKRISFIHAFLCLLSSTWDTKKKKNLMIPSVPTHAP